MELKLQRDTLLEMSKRLQKEWSNIESAGPLKTGVALEVLSHVLGYKNWDTLSGLVKASANSAPTGVEGISAADIERVGYRLTPPKVGKPFTFFWEAFACDEWGEGPAWAKLEVTQAFVDELHKLQTQCLKDKVNLSVDHSVDEWDNEDSLRLHGVELHVTQSLVWLSAHPKQANYNVETRLMDIKDFFDAIEGNNTQWLAWADGVLFKDGASAKELAQGLVDNGELDIEESRIDFMPSN